MNGRLFFARPEKNAFEKKLDKNKSVEGNLISFDLQKQFHKLIPIKLQNKDCLKKGLFDDFDNADEALKDLLYVIKRGRRDISEFLHLKTDECDQLLNILHSISIKELYHLLKYKKFCTTSF